MGSRFKEFPQTSRGRGFSLLGFYSSFKYDVNVSVGLVLEQPFDRFRTLEQKCWDLRPTNSLYQFYGLFGSSV